MSNNFKGRHFQGEVILWAVRWYCRYGISYRKVEEMLAERGVAHRSRGTDGKPLVTTQYIFRDFASMKVVNRFS